MNPTVHGALIGAGGAAIVAIAGFLANVKNTSETAAVSKRAVEVSQQAVEAAKRTVELTEQGQVADRYTKAIEQLGSDKLDVRIGGIYALERVARDSPKDHPTVMEVLAAFIRRHSREPWPPPAEPGAGPSTRPDIYAPPTRPDVYAAVTVIGRRTVRNDSQPINLFGAKIHGTDLTSPDLTRVRLHHVDLAKAEIGRAHV